MTALDYSPAHSRLATSAVYACVLLIYLICAPLMPAHGSNTPQPNFSPCHVTGVEALAQCAELHVPLDWSNPDGEHIALHVAVVPPSGGAAGDDPIYVLAGGPGQAASDLGGLISGPLNAARRGRATIIVAQRGTGQSAPFDCQLPADVTTPGDEVATLCLQQTSNDPRFFGSFMFVNDLHFVRNALGHKTINLWGGSYGTRAALFYLREYEHTVRSVILDAVAAPPTAFMRAAPRSAGRALDTMLESCRNDAACHASFPNLRNDLNTVLTELNETPRIVTIAGQDISVDRSVFLNALRNAFYARESTSWLPLAISEFAAGNEGPWRAMGDLAGQIMNDISLGTMLSVMCGEEIPRMQANGIAETSTAFADIDLSFWHDACDVWPAAEVPANFDLPVSSDVPVLLLSGSMDPVTPPAFAEIAQATLTRSKHLVAEHNSHITSAYGCAPRLIATFLDSLDPASIDDSCLNRIGPAPFLLTPAGPAP